jgi:hypothetical protein
LIAARKSNLVAAPRRAALSSSHEATCTSAHIWREDLSGTSPRPTARLGAEEAGHT